MRCDFDFSSILVSLNFPSIILDIERALSSFAFWDYDKQFGFPVPPQNLV